MFGTLSKQMKGESEHPTEKSRWIFRICCVNIFSCIFRKKNEFDEKEGKI